MDPFNVSLGKDKESTGGFPKVPLEIDSFLLIQMVLVIAVSIFGLVGNTLIIIVITSSKQMKSIPINFFLISLAFSDLVFIVVRIVDIMLEILFLFSDITFNFSPWTWTLLTLFDYTSYMTSLYLTICIAGDRYMALKWPLRFTQFRTLKSAKWKSLFCVLFCFLCCCWVVFKPTDGILKYTLLLLVLCAHSVVPSALLLTLNIGIIAKARKDRRERRELFEGSRSQENAPKSSPTIMLVAVISLALICVTFLPLVLHILRAILRNPYFNIYINKINNYLQLVNSSANFLIYAFWGTQFRVAFCKLFSKIRGRQ